MPLIRILLAACALAASSALWAQCGVSMTCTDTPPGITGLPGIGLPGVCKPGVCLKDDAKAEYEKKHHCKFPAGDMCGEMAIDKRSQCCTKDVQSGKAKIRNRQITVLDGEFNWDNYKKECTGMRQSEAPPDGLWAKCEAEKKHDAEDTYVVKEVVKNGESRPYCIDGCSTPPDAIEYLHSIGDFLFKDKDNPTGKGVGGYGEESSFYGSCASHDKCYQTCNGNDQKTCDDILLSDMLAVCERISAKHVTPVIATGGKIIYKNTQYQCGRAANDMHTGLRAPIEKSKIAFKKRRQQYCQCC